MKTKRILLLAAAFFIAGVIAFRSAEIPSQRQPSTSSPVRHAISLKAAPRSVAVARQQLSAPLTVYVSPTGNDANDGLTALMPLQSINAAVNLAANGYDPNGYQITIQLSPGTYAPFQLLNYLDAGLVAQQTNAVIQGDSANPSAYVIAGANGTPAALAVGVRSTWTICGVTLQSPDANGYGLEADFGSNVYLDGVQFGLCGLADVVSLFGSRVEFLSRAGRPLFTVAGNTQSVLWAYEQATIILQDSPGGLPFAFVGNPSWSQFAVSQNLGFIYMGIGFTGTYVGIHPLYLTNYGGLQGVANVPPVVGGTNIINTGGWYQ